MTTTDREMLFAHDQALSDILEHQRRWRDIITERVTDLRDAMTAMSERLDSYATALTEAESRVADLERRVYPAAYDDGHD